MDVDSPRSPTTQFSIAGSDPSTSYVCPSPPRKPSLRREQQTGNFDVAIRCARDLLEAMTEEERQAALKHLPRHSLEGVFLAFCHWQAGTNQGLGFKALTALAPGLEQELLDHVQRCCPNLTWEDWVAQVREAVSDPCLGQQLAERIMSDSHSTRRVLF